MTYILLALAIQGNAAFLGEYQGLAACQKAIREIYLTKWNPLGQRLPEIEKAVDLQLSIQREYTCIPKAK